MLAAKIRQRIAVDNTAFFCPQYLFKNFDGIGPGHGIESIKFHGETVAEQFLQGFKIKDIFHHLNIIFDRIYDLNLHIAEFALAKLG